MSDALIYSAVNTAAGHKLELPHINYAPIEVIAYKDYSPSSDMWSLGMCFSFMLTQQVPFSGMSPGEIRKHIGRGKLPVIPIEVSESIDLTIRGCWKLKPEDRPSAFTVHTMFDDIVGNGSSAPADDGKHIAVLDAGVQVAQGIYKRLRMSEGKPLYRNINGAARMFWTAALGAWRIGKTGIDEFWYMNSQDDGDDPPLDGWEALGSDDAAVKPLPTLEFGDDYMKTFQFSTANPGIQFNKTKPGQAPKVLNVYATTDAAQVGIMKGWELKTINGRAAKDYTKSMAAIFEAQKGSYDLVFKTKVAYSYDKLDPSQLEWIGEMQSSAPTVQARKEQVRISANVEVYVGLTNDTTTLKAGRCGKIFERTAKFAKIRLEDNSEYVVLPDDFSKLQQLDESSKKSVRFDLPKYKPKDAVRSVQSGLFGTVIAMDPKRKPSQYQVRWLAGKIEWCGEAEFVSPNVKLQMPVRLQNNAAANKFMSMPAFSVPRIGSGISGLALRGLVPGMGQRTGSFQVPRTFSHNGIPYRAPSGRILPDRAFSSDHVMIL